MGPALLSQIVKELNEWAAGGVISKVHQPDARNLIFKIFVRGREERLVISAHPRYSRMHLTGRGFINPPAPLRFCAYLRSVITNARIEGFGQADLEKIVHMRLRKYRVPPPDGGETETFTLICELTGKSSNMILIDEKGVVLDSLRYFPTGTSSRAVMPGLALQPLPKRTAEEEPPEKEPVTKEKDETWNQAADRHYSRLLDKEWEELERGRLRRVINGARKKAERKLKNLLGDREKAGKEFSYYKIGEILVANLGKLKRGMKEVEAEDYSVYPPEKKTIALDERLAPGENADKYFKRAKKAKVALSLLEERVPRVDEELQYIDSLSYGLDSSRDIDDLKELKDELIKEGYIKMQEKTPARGLEERKEPVRRYTSSEGFEILCGKSGPGNDLIVKKYAKDEDIWFHASGAPGSHVLIKTAGRRKELTKKTIEEAAALAAWHSKNQTAGKTEVTYTEARNVKKPRGAKPGLVTIKDYKTIVVRPKAMEQGEKD